VSQSHLLVWQGRRTRSHLLSIYVYYLLLACVFLLVHAIVLLFILLIVIALHFLALVVILFLLSVLVGFLHFHSLNAAVLEILLVISLLIDGLHVLLLRHLLARYHVRHLNHLLAVHLGHHHAWLYLVDLHHVTLHLLLEPLRAQALVPRRTERPDFFLASSDIWRRQLPVVVTREVAVRGLAREQSLAALLLLKVAYGPLVAVRVVRRERLRALRLGPKPLQ